MIELNSVLNCVRVMDYKGTPIHYTTDICNEVKISSGDMAKVLSDNSRTSYNVVDLFDLMVKANLISPAIFNSFQERKILNEFSNQYINIDVFIKLCDNYGEKAISKFLIKAKNQINEIGLYIGEINYKGYDKRKCSDKNLSSTLSLNAVSSYADLNNMGAEDVYVEVCNIVSNLVFGKDLHEVRSDYGMYFDDYLCDMMTQAEFDEVSFLCSVISYMLKYSDISFKGMEIFCFIALQAYHKHYTPVNYDYRDFKRNTTEYNDPYLQPLQDVQDKMDDLEDFRRYM